MIELFPYILKSLICFACGYFFFKVMFENENNLVFKRFYLLLSALFAVIVPLVTIHLSIPSTQDIAYTLQDSNLSWAKESFQLIESDFEKNKFDWHFTDLIKVIYVLISLSFLARFLFNVGNVVKNIVSNQKLNYDRKTKLVLAEKSMTPHSFLNYVFLNREDYYRGSIGKEILLHEKAHCDQLHSIDILIMELLKIVFWWNPFIWFYKDIIQLNHEYLADEAVLQHVNIIDYQKAIVCNLENANQMALTSPFNYNSIKKRFIMMTNSNQNSKKQVFKILLMLPVILALLAFSVNIQAQQSDNQKQKEQKVKIVLKGEDMSKEDIDALIKEQLSKLNMLEEDINVNVNTNDGVTEITIDGKKIDVYKLSPGDETEKNSDVRVIKKERSDETMEWISKDSERDDTNVRVKVLKKEDVEDEDLQWIEKSLKDKNSEIRVKVLTEEDSDGDIKVIIKEGIEGEETVSKIIKDLEIELENISGEVKVIQKEYKNKLNDELDDIKIYLEELDLGADKERVIKIIEEEFDNDKGNEEKRIIIKEIQIEEDQKKSRKKNKRSK